MSKKSNYVPTEYLKEDNFYDVESLANIFTVAQYFPAKNQIIIGYLDDDKIIKTKEDLDAIRAEIKRVNPQTEKMGIFFEDLSNPNPKFTIEKGEHEGTLITFARRFGIAVEDNFLNKYTPENVVENPYQTLHNGYYPIKDTDLNYNPQLHGRFFGYNSKNYDTTIIAKFLSTIPHELLNHTTLPDGRPVGDNNVVMKLLANDTLRKDDLPQMTAREMRRYNDLMFSPEYKSSMPNILVKQVEYENQYGRTYTKKERSDAFYIRHGWMLTNRHVDVANLNEKQAKVGLKRLAGMLGMQIKESDRLSNGNNVMRNMQDICELMAYNVSDILCTEELFRHKVYQNNYKLKSNLLKLYPEAVYEKKEDEYKADENPNKVKWSRLTSDSTSAQFVTQVIAPYNQLIDDDYISFDYPAKSVAERLGVEQFNVLEDSMKWAEENIPNGRKAFQPIYDFYKDIEGRNANELMMDKSVTVYVDPKTKHIYPVDKKHNKLVWVSDGKGNIQKLEKPLDIPTNHKPDTRLLRDVYPWVDMSAVQRKHNTNWFYRLNEVDENGDAIESSCMVTFSNGGIHGQEIDMVHLENLMLEKQSLYDALQQAKKDYDDDATEAYRQNQEYPVYKKIPKSKKKFEWSTIKARSLCKTGSTISKGAEWKEIEPPTRESIVFTHTEKDGYKLNKDLTYVSIGKSNHEDFASYYPLLLSQLAVFRNPELGSDTDPYYNLFLDRLADKKAMGKAKHERDALKDLPNAHEFEEQIQDLSRKADLLNLRQDSKKLLLNSASGAGDAKFKSNIRKNNAVIAMRIIGQLFAWRIGQAQTLAGARVPSTNTDGLYTMDIDEELNDKILMDVVSTMYVDIEPERLDRFVTKDSNNRMEYYQGRIESAKGGALTSHEGASPTQSLSHPAVIDYALAQYLARHEDPSNQNFDREFARELFEEVIENETPDEALRYFQWVLASSSASNRYPFLMHVKPNIKEDYDVLMENVDDIERINNMPLNERKLSNGGLIEVEENPIETIPHYNRIFLMKRPENNEPFSVAYVAARRKVNDKDVEKRRKKGIPITVQDPTARKVLAKNGYTLNPDIHDEAYMTKISQMPEDQCVLINNYDLRTLENPEEILNNLDIDAYIGMLESTFTNAWLNTSAPTVDSSKIIS